MESNIKVKHAGIKERISLFQYLHSDFKEKRISTGWVIDNEGYVKKYPAATPLNGWQIPGNEVFSMYQLKTSCTLAEREVMKLSGKELRHAMRLIGDVIEGPFSNVLFRDEDLSSTAFFVCRAW